MLYDIGFFLFALFYLPALVFKGRLHRDFPERFGLYANAKLKALGSPRGKIWIQAVSVGEVALCKVLIPRLKEEFPDTQIVLSTITKAGGDLAKKLFVKDVIMIYFPLDFGFIINRVVNLIRPRCYIMIETEIWPNLLRALASRSIPSILINGRISDRSYGRYALAKPFLKKILKKVGRFCMQSDIDAERITDLGAPSDRVTVTGNMKFDMPLIDDKEVAQKITAALSLKPDDRLFVAGSTHEGEEDMVIEVFKDLSKEFPNLKLLIAPRHLDRINAIESLIRKRGFSPVRVSNPDEPRTPNPEPRTTNHEPRIYILDTIGQLNSAYSLAAVVFIGGSLVKYGGHNSIEPAMFGKAVLFGPYMFNFRDIARIFLEKNAALQVNDATWMMRDLKVLLRDNEARVRLGTNAKQVVIANRGATARNMEAICGILSTR